MDGDGKAAEGPERRLDDVLDVAVVAFIALVAAVLAPRGLEAGPTAQWGNGLGAVTIHTSGAPLMCLYRASTSWNGMTGGEPLAWEPSEPDAVPLRPQLFLLPRPFAADALCALLVGVLVVTVRRRRASKR